MYTAYTDGGCAWNPGGAGGCACIIISDEGEKRLSEGYVSTTNNRMEIRAVILALRNIPEGEQVRIFSDSQYVINCATGEWSKEKNADLWHALDSLAKKRSVSYRWVRGHSGNRNNERCDRMCVEAMNSEGLLQDTGFHMEGGRTERKTGAMGYDIPEDISERDEVMPPEDYAEAHGISIGCAEDIQHFFSSGKGFRDYAGIRTHGRDAWSSARAESISGFERIAEICEGIGLPESRVKSAARWHARGLSTHDSVRKVLVDAEVARNALNGKRKGKRRKQ